MVSAKDVTVNYKYIFTWRNLFIRYNVEEEVKNFQPKRVKDNLTPEEKEVLKALCNYSSIVIKPEDKGSSLIVQEKHNYIAKACEELDNNNVYLRLDSDPTKENVEVVKAIGDKMFKEGDIDDKAADYLVPEKAKLSRFYTLPKTHKGKGDSVNVPIRPVISGCGPVTERLSHFVDFYLKPHVSELDSYVKDSKHLMRKIECINSERPLPEGSTLFTIDVVATYPSIPKDLGLAAAREVFNQRSVKVPSTDNLMQCLEICLDSNTFEFNNEHFKQIYRTAFGPKMSPAYACLAMGLVDQRMWRESPRKPKKWDRYIEDVMGIWLHGKQAFN